MIKTRRVLFVFFLIVVQSAIAVSAGAGTLYFLSQKSLPPSVYAGDIPVGGMSYSDAAKSVEDGYAGKFKQDSIKLQTEKETFEIPYSQINAKVDGRATVDAFKSNRDLSGIPMLFSDYFGGIKPAVKPVVRFNEGKLREVLIGLSDKMYVAPVDAKIIFNNGIIEKKAGTDGVTLNVANAAELIEKQISENPWKTVEFKRADNYELQFVTPEKSLKDYDEIQQVLAGYSTEITGDQLTNSIKLAVESINGVILPAKAEGDGQEFSFVERLTKADPDFGNDNEGYDQVASTLYAALLTAGIPVDSITRLPHKLAPDYIEPGLDAWISGDAGDLRFTNPFGHKLAIFAKLENGRIEVAIAGNINDKKQNYKLTTEITQKFEPPVYYVESKDLKQGQKIILNPGKAGVMVNVLRNGELIGSDKYEAEQAIVQIAPGTNWEDAGK